MENTSKKTTALICGILALILGVVSLFFLYFLAIPALILGIVAVSMASQSAKINVPATGGLVMGVLGIVFSALGLACWLVCASAAASLT